MAAGLVAFFHIRENRDPIRRRTWPSSSVERATDARRAYDVDRRPPLAGEPRSTGNI
jgi:hypothetical protein